MLAAEKILWRMPDPLAGILRRTEKPLLEKVTEIRLRAGEPLALSVGEQAVFCRRRAGRSRRNRAIPLSRSWCRRQ